MPAISHRQQLDTPIEPATVQADEFLQRFREGKEESLDAFQLDESAKIWKRKLPASLQEPQPSGACRCCCCWKTQPACSTRKSSLRSSDSPAAQRDLPRTWTAGAATMLLWRLLARHACRGAYSHSLTQGLVYSSGFE